MLRTRMNGPDEVLARLDRIEKKLDLLLEFMAEEDDEDEPQFDLDGNPAGAPRDPSESLS